MDSATVGGGGNKRERAGCAQQGVGELPPWLFFHRRRRLLEVLIFCL